MPAKTEILLPLKNITEEQERILKTARSMFYIRGFKGASMDDIARELGMSKKTLYEHFPGKQALVSSVLDLNLREMLPRMISIVRSDLRADLKLEQMARIPIEHLPRLVSPVMIADLQKYYPHLWEKIDRARSQAIMQYSRVIDEGKASGVFRQDLDTEVVTMIFIRTVQGVVNPEYLSQGTKTLPEIVGTIFNLFTRGILEPQYKRSKKI